MLKMGRAMDQMGQPSSEPLPPPFPQEKKEDSKSPLIASPNSKIMTDIFNPLPLKQKFWAHQINSMDGRIIGFTNDIIEGPCALPISTIMLLIIRRRIISQTLCIT